MARNTHLGKDGDKALDAYRKKELNNLPLYMAEARIIRRCLIEKKILLRRL